jgi:hypothetical protein
MSTSTTSIATIATLATSPALEDLHILLGTLQLFNMNPPTVYLYCDSTIAAAIPGIKYSGKIHLRDVLSPYTAYERRDMESMPGVQFKSPWLDFMTEKINLLRWALSDVSGGVFLCDADICFTGPLPSVPEGTTVALSPHMIVERDERRFGKYNGGFLWMRSRESADVWWDACAGARYYEQSALEDVAKHAGSSLYEFSRTTNYGWWRLWQGVKSSGELLQEWKVNRMKCPQASGICISGEPLASVHTHFQTQDMATRQFNAMFLALLDMLAPYHLPARKLLGIIRQPKA